MGNDVKYKYDILEVGTVCGSVFHFGHLDVVTSDGKNLIVYRGGVDTKRVTSFPERNISYMYSENPQRVEE